MKRLMLPFISTESSDILNITGSKTPELTLRSNYAADENVYCQVSSPLATNSPLDRHHLKERKLKEWSLLSLQSN